MTDKQNWRKIGGKHHIFLYLVVLIAFPTQASQSFKLSSWNTEWLVSKGNERFSSSLRTNTDFYKMADYFQQLDADVLAFQEVGDKAAIQRVVGDEYQLYFSDRLLPKNRHLQFDDINQYTGFAVRKSLPVFDVADLSLVAEDDQSKLRFASYIIISPDSSPIHLLNVHLKAGCSGKLTHAKQCRTLKEQSRELNKWIAAREKNNQPYIIAGDFNHNLSFKGDWMWKIVSDGNDARLASKGTRAECKVRSRNNPKRTHQFRSLIDHIIVSKDVNIESIAQQPYSTADILKYRLSDHCPLSAEIRY